MFRPGRSWFSGYITFINLICFIGSSCITYYIFNHIFIWHSFRQARLNGYLPESMNFKHKNLFVSITAPGTHHIKADSVNSKKTILLWTKFFGQDYWITDSVFSECEISQCKVSLDKLELELADAVVFHPRDIPSNAWPSMRLQHQRWILFSMEPPYYNGLDYAAYRNVFNWTMLMRRDSDFPLSYLGIVAMRDFHLTEKSELWRNLTIILNSKRRLVAARISNCMASTTNRMEYIEELRKYIPVDVYGKCGNFPCNNPSACIKELRLYKFYLSFENGFCRNYITEKFWLPFEQFDSVPVVMGGAHVDDYKEIAPLHSYINIADFSSPEQLGKYLIRLDKSPLLYSAFFKWQLISNIVPVVPTWSQLFVPGLNTAVNRKSPWCDVCRSLHDPSLRWQHYHDIDGWVKDDTCMKLLHYKPNNYVLLLTIVTCVPVWFLTFFSLHWIMKFQRYLH